MLPSSSADMQQLQKIIKSAKNIAVLTGAGVSAASGIPTFRGSGGLWRKYDPVMLATPQAFVRDPSLVWEFYSWRREVVSQCKPNAAHYALAMYEQQAFAEGKDFTLITQNIDRLHQAAGSQNVIELHGSLWDVCRATAGGYRDPSKPAWEDRRQPLVPALEGCGAPDGEAADIPVDELPQDDDGTLLRPGVVWFNENLDEEVIDKVEDCLAACDLLLIVGTSSVVYPAAGYAPQVAARGVPVVELNMEATANSKVCTLSIQGPADKLLPEALEVKEEMWQDAAAAGGHHHRHHHQQQEQQQEQHGKK